MRLTMLANSDAAWWQARVIPQWPSSLMIQDSVMSAMTTRVGGALNDVRGFNLAQHVGDEARRVQQNRAQVETVFGRPLAWLNQTHSATVVDVDEVMPDILRGIPVNADASVSFSTRYACVVMTADCLPILLCSNDGKAVAAIHAGWRGVINGVIEATVAKLQLHHPATYAAWLGVCIGLDAFEVGPEVRAQFMDAGFSKTAFKASADKTSDKAVAKTSDRYYADLHALAQLALARVGVTQVSAASGCTFAQGNQFYSYRRDTQQHAPQGRMASVIARRV